MIRWQIPVGAGAVAALIALSAPVVMAAPDEAPSLLIRNARVFDGTGAPALVEAVLTGCRVSCKEKVARRRATAHVAPR